MYPVYNNEMEHLAPECYSDQDLEADSDVQQDLQPIQACRAMRHGMIAMAVFALVGIACLNFSSQASHSALKDVQVKAGLYSNGAFNQLPEATAASPAPAAPAAPAAAPVAPAAPVPAVPAVGAEPASKPVVLNPQINSVNDLTGGNGVKVSAASSNPMAPDENMADGNECCDDEEKFEKLCYKKCSILTNGQFDTRVSAFQCAKGGQLEDFFQSQSKGFPVPCTGFDVAGDECGKGCPHSKGACLVTEEMFLGKCFKKCSDLTAKQYPVRTSAATCCATSNLIECINPSNSKMSMDFAVGGGVSEKEQQPHDPELSLTEATR
ncbi:Hypothetical protein SCF082_LOCUS48844 [Durusdinium trenchii]